MALTLVTLLPAPVDAAPLALIPHPRMRDEPVRGRHAMGHAHRHGVWIPGRTTARHFDGRGGRCEHDSITDFLTTSGDTAQAVAWEESWQRGNGLVPDAEYFRGIRKPWIMEEPGIAFQRGVRVRATWFRSVFRASWRNRAAGVGV